MSSTGNHGVNIIIMRKSESPPLSISCDKADGQRYIMRIIIM
jgi:hypothetical protein